MTEKRKVGGGGLTGRKSGGKKNKSEINSGNINSDEILG